MPVSTPSKQTVPALAEICQKVLEDGSTFVIPVKSSFPDYTITVIPAEVGDQSIIKKQVATLKNLCEAVLKDNDMQVASRQVPALKNFNKAVPENNDIQVASNPEVVMNEDSVEKELDELDRAVINAHIDLWNTEDDFDMDVDDSVGAETPQFSDDEDGKTQSSPSKEDKNKPKDEAAKLLDDSQRCFSSILTSGAYDGTANDYDRRVSGTGNMQVPVVKPLPKKDPKPELPDKIAFYIGVDKVDQDREKTLRMMTTENLITSNLKLSEALHHKFKMEADDNALLAKFGDREVVQNPIIRAKELCNVKAAQIYRPESELNKRRIIIHAAGEWPLEDYNLVEILAFNLTPTGRHLWVPSVEILQVANKDFEDTTREMIMDRDKEIARLKEELKKAKEGTPPKGSTPEYDPKGGAVEINDGSQRPILLDSAGTENPRLVKEKPYQCGICGNRLKTKHSLKQHTTRYHGEKSGEPKMKECDECYQSFTTSDYYKPNKHGCRKKFQKEKKKQKGKLPMTK